MIVYCQADIGSCSFFGLVCENEILELTAASNAYIQFKDSEAYLGDKFNYWTITKILQAKLTITDILAEI